MGDIERAPTDRDEARAEPQVVVRVARSILDVAPEDWNACAAGGTEFEAT
jgi:hypothetical protein